MGQKQGAILAAMLGTLAAAGARYSHALSREPLQALQSLDPIKPLEPLEPLEPQAPLEPLLLVARSNPLLSSLLEYARHQDLEQLFDDQPAVKRDDYEEFTDAGDSEAAKPCNCVKGNTTRYLGADYIPSTVPEKICDHTKCPPYALCYNETITITVFKRCDSEPGPRQTVHRWPKVQRLDSSIIRHECLREERLPVVSACTCKEHSLAKRRVAAP